MKEAKDKEGLSIRILGRAGMLFQDHNDMYFIDTEMLTGNVDFVIFSDGIRHGSATGDIVSEEKRNEIISTVKKMLQADGIKVEVQ
jgi:hypothetical protein